MRTEHLPPTPEGIARAAQLLREGRTVAFPTETVYGLGANALDAAAVGRIFEAKQRPSWDPLIVHIASRAQLASIATLNPAADLLIAAFWPGPLTLLLPRTPAVPNSVTAGRPLVGVRIPNHPVALELLRAVNLPIAAPSANTFGHTSPTTAAHVLADLDGRIDAVLDGGPTTIGLESTVAEPRTGNRRGLSPPEVVIYRPGAITDEMIEQAGIGRVCLYSPAVAGTPPDSLPSPGVGIRHYAPRALLVLVDPGPRDRTPVQTLLSEAIDNAQTETSKVAVLLPQSWHPASADVIYDWGLWHSPEMLASRLFAGLRALDDAGATVILAPLPPGEGIGQALRDRLQKAARTA